MEQLVIALFAGYDTTSVTLMRIVQFLALDDGPAAAEALKQELDSNDISAADKMGDASYMKSDRPLSGLLKNFPILEAVLYEANR